MRLSGQQRVHKLENKVRKPIAPNQAKWEKTHYSFTFVFLAIKKKESLKRHPIALKLANNDSCSV